MSFNKFLDKPITRLDKGLFTNDEESKIPVEASPDLQNVDFETAGSITMRRGTSAFGGQVDSASGITTLHNYKRYDGVEIPIRTWSTEVEYYNRETSGWTRLSAGFSANKRYGFADYDGFTYFCNDTDAMFRWNGYYGSISAAHAASATVIELNENLTQWLSAGEAIVGTQAIYYGSRTSGTLSACTGISAVIAQDAAISQAPTSSRGFGSVSSVPRGNILHVDTDRLFVAGISSFNGSPQYTTLYYSKIGDPTDFTQNSPRVDDDGGTVTLGDGGGPITGLASRERGKVVIFKKNAIKGFEFVPLDNTTTDFPRVSNIANSLNSGSESYRGITNVESNVFFIAPIGGVRGIFQGNTIGLTTRGISDDITPTVNALNHVSAAAIYHNKRFYVTSRETTANTNNTVLIYDTIADRSNGAWTRYDGWNVNDWMEFDGGLYYAASNEKTVYKALVNYTDDGIPFNSYWSSKLINHEVPHELKRLRYIYMEGYITQAAVVSATLTYDAISSDSKQFVIYGNGAYVDESQTVTFGDIPFGGSVFGGDPSGSDVVLNKFRVRLSYNLQNLFNYQIKVASQNDGTVWRVDQIVPYVERMDGVVFPTSNIIGIGS